MGVHGVAMVQALHSRLLVGLGWWGFPVGIVAMFATVGLALEQFGIVKAFYASPFVLAVVVSTSRSGRRGGYLASVLSTAVFNLVFVRPVTAFTIPTPEELLAYLSMLGAAYVVGGIMHTPAPPADVDSYSGTLPFVRDNNNDTESHRSFWDVAQSGDWLDDCTVGHQYARIYMARRQRYGAPILSWIVRDMIRAGRYTGIEAGFISAITMHLPRRATMTLIPNNHTTQGHAH